jgi:hypothetical protein
MQSNEKAASGYLSFTLIMAMGQQGRLLTPIYGHSTSSTSKNATNNVADMAKVRHTNPQRRLGHAAEGQ